MKKLIVAVAQHADRMWRARKSYEPQHGGHEPQHAAGDTTEYTGRHRYDWDKALFDTDRAEYHKPGAVHESSWYDESTGPWALIEPMVPLGKIDATVVSHTRRRIVDRQHDTQPLAVAAFNSSI